MRATRPRFTKSAEGAMQQESDRDYHTRRAREELDRAYRADRWTAMSAHFRLSSLHMQKVREHSGAAILAGMARVGAALTTGTGAAQARARAGAEARAFA